MCLLRNVHTAQANVKIKGHPGSTNGIPQGCPFSVIVINVLTTTWKQVIDDIRQPVTITTRGLPLPEEPELPACWWVQRGVVWSKLGLEEMPSPASTKTSRVSI